MRVSTRAVGSLSKSATTVPLSACLHLGDLPDLLSVWDVAAAHHVVMDAVVMMMMIKSNFRLV